MGSIDYPIGSPNVIKEVYVGSNNKYTYVQKFDQIGDIARIDQEPDQQFKGKIKVYSEDESLVGTSQLFNYRNCKKSYGTPYYYEWQLQVNVIENLPI